jgi:hypothetical protein
MQGTIEIISHNNTVCNSHVVDMNEISFSLSLLWSLLVILCCPVHVLALPGNWALVRRVQPGISFHPAGDNVLGFDVYGTPTNDETAAVTFSRLFEDAVPQWNEAMFITGDRTKWMIMRKSEVRR